VEDGERGRGVAALPAITPSGMSDSDATTLIAVAKTNEQRQTTAVFLNGRY
jgi:hypothetical protein